MPKTNAPIVDISLLARLPLFKDVPERELFAFASIARIDRFESDSIIFYQGDPCDKVWLLLQGRAKMVHHEEDGREVILELIQAGEMFGGATIFLDEHPATAHTITPVETASFPVQGYRQLLTDYPGVAIRLIYMLGMRLHSVMELHILAGERVERRLAHILLKLAERAGRRQPDGILITLTLSRQDLADMSGTTLETAIRLMSRFRSEGMVKTLRGGYLLITNEAELRHLAKP